jgi:Tfp pilus assembly protein FimV
MSAKQKPKKPLQTALEPADEQPDPVDEAIEKSEALAASQLDMARLFLTHGKTDIAQRRLQDVVENYGKSEAAKEARKLLTRI